MLEEELTLVEHSSLDVIERDDVRPLADLGQLVSEHSLARRPADLSEVVAHNYALTAQSFFCPAGHVTSRADIMV